jgi:hypothetical protein
MPHLSGSDYRAVMRRRKSILHFCRPSGGVLIRTAGVHGGRRKSAKKLCFESGFSFLSDFPAVSGCEQENLQPEKNEISFFRWAATLSTPKIKTTGPAGGQIIDKVNILSDAEKHCKARKRRLQKRTHTQTYITDFAICVDESSRNFDLARGLSGNFCDCGVCQRSGHD